MRTYAGFLIAIPVITAALFAAYGASIYLFFRAPLGYQGEGLWLHNAIVKKEAIAASMSGPKIIFAGGSATLFGVRARDIQDAYGVPVVNAAIHAALEADYMLHLARGMARPGDAVILPAEYDLFRYEGRYNQSRSFYLRTYDRGFFNGQPVLTILDDVYKTTPADVLNAVKRQIIYAHDPNERPVGMAYTTETLNGNGDETYNYGNAKMAKVMKTARPSPVGGFKETKGLRAIKEFAAWARDNNVRFYVTYANAVWFKEYGNDEYRRYFAELDGYFRENGIGVIGAPRDFFYDAGLFYDTNYHLNHDGVTIRTNQLMGMMEGMGIIGPPIGARRR
ncbi:MAG: hypothetical protein HY894_07765 [Deltaproteobacteria bacterium]|nr:hypothetical protein [Deltaproteobacteria bacterium]